MHLICQSHKRTNEYICLNTECYLQSKQFEAICSQCVLIGKHKSHEVIDFLAFIGSLHNHVNSDLNINQYLKQIDEQIKQQIELITSYLTHQSKIIQKYLKLKYESHKREQKQASLTLNILENLINSKQEDVQENEINISQFEIQQLVHLYTGKLGFDRIIQDTQRELERITNAVNNIVSDKHYFHDLAQSFQNSNSLINQNKLLHTIDINGKQNSNGFQRMNSITLLDGKYCFCQIDYKSILIASQGSIKLIDAQTQSIRKMFPYIQLRHGFDVEVNKIYSRKGQFFYYNIGQNIVEVRSIYDNKVSHVYKFNFNVSSCFIQKNIMYLGSTLGDIHVFNYLTKKFIFQFRLELNEIVISLLLLSPNILLAGQIENFENGRVSIIDLCERKVIKQFYQFPEIELENYIIELVKVNPKSFVCGFGDLRLYNLHPFSDNILNKFSFEWEMFHDCQVYRNRFLLLKEIDFIIMYDLNEDKVIHEIPVTQFLTQKVIGIYYIENSIVLITDRGKVQFLSIQNQ